MPGWTNVAGCAIEPDLIYLAQHYDDYGTDRLFTRMTFYDGQNMAAPWVSHDLQWQVVSVCVWHSNPYCPRAYIALSAAGEVEIVGPGGRPHFTERVAKAGTPGSMAAVRQIGGHLYACGSGLRTFRRGPSHWDDFTAPGDADRTSDFVAQYFDINGPAEDDLFAVGMNRPDTSRIAHYDGTAWTTLDDAVPPVLTCIEPAQRGGVYIGGRDGTVLYGDRARGFVRVAETLPNTSIYGLREFGGRLYIASSRGFFYFDHQQNRVDYVRPPIDPVLLGISRLDSVDGTLWAFGPKDLAWYDGLTWHRLVDPENLRPTP